MHTSCSKKQKPHFEREKGLHALHIHMPCCQFSTAQCDMLRNVCQCSLGGTIVQQSRYKYFPAMSVGFYGDANTKQSVLCVYLITFIVDAVWGS